MTKPPARKNPQPPQKTVQQAKVGQVQQMIHQGPIPHPDILRGFDELLPGSAKRIVDMAEAESIHRRELEARALTANIEAQHKQLEITDTQNKIVHRSDRNGQIAGLIVSLTCIAGAAWLANNGHDLVAGLLAAIPTAAVIKAFFVHRSK